MTSEVEVKLGEIIVKTIQNFATSPLREQGEGFF